MKNVAILLIILCGVLFEGTLCAQTYFYQYQYTKTTDGAKINDSRHHSWDIMTFSNNKSFVQQTDRQGVSRSNSGYRYSYSDSGFKVYKPSNTGGDARVNDMAQSMYQSGMKATYGWYPIAVSFGDSYNIMLVHQSNGSNQVWQRISDPSKPNISY